MAGQVLPHQRRHLEKVDPASLQRAGVLSATYAYFLAGAGGRGGSLAWQEMLARFRCRAHLHGSEPAYRSWPRRMATD